MDVKLALFDVLKFIFLVGWWVGMYTVHVTRYTLFTLPSGHWRPLSLSRSLSLSLSLSLCLCLCLCLSLTRVVRSGSYLNKQVIRRGFRIIVYGVGSLAVFHAWSAVPSQASRRHRTDRKGRHQAKAPLRQPLMTKQK